MVCAVVASATAVRESAWLGLSGMDPGRPSFGRAKSAAAGAVRAESMDNAAARGEAAGAQERASTATATAAAETGHNARPDRLVDCFLVVRDGAIVEEVCAEGAVVEEGTQLVRQLGVIVVLCWCDGVMVSGSACASPLSCHVFPAPWILCAHGVEL